MPDNCWKESLMRSPVDISIYRKIAYHSNKLELTKVLQQADILCFCSGIAGFELMISFKYKYPRYNSLVVIFKFGFTYL